jgi:hypothetical protein
MRPIVLTTILVATAVISKGPLLNDMLVIEAYNANNLYRPYSDVSSNNLDHLTEPAYVAKPIENAKKSFDWAI